MGHIFALSGPSGAGKTTFLRAVTSLAGDAPIRLLPRYTDRPIREGEQEGFEYHFLDHEGFLQRVYANDFIHVEKWGTILGTQHLFLLNFSSWTPSFQRSPCQLLA